VIAQPACQGAARAWSHAVDDRDVAERLDDAQHFLKRCACGSIRQVMQEAEAPDAVEGCATERQACGVTDDPMVAVRDHRGDGPRRAVHHHRVEPDPGEPRARSGAHIEHALAGRALGCAALEVCA
jgi:hypothetical protein